MERIIAEKENKEVDEVDDPGKQLRFFKPNDLYGLVLLSYANRLCMSYCVLLFVFTTASPCILKCERQQFPVMSIRS